MQDEDETHKKIIRTNGVRNAHASIYFLWCVATLNVHTTSPVETHFFHCSLWFSFASHSPHSLSSLSSSTTPHSIYIYQHHGFHRRSCLRVWVCAPRIDVLVHTAWPQHRAYIVSAQFTLIRYSCTYRTTGDTQHFVCAARSPPVEWERYDVRHSIDRCVTMARKQTWLRERSHQS